MNNSYKYFENHDCRYYPCHETPENEGLNCLFCFCPLYTKEHCPGNPGFKDKNGKRIKICRDCTFPHKKENYEKILENLPPLPSPSEEGENAKP